MNFSAMVMHKWLTAAQKPTPKSQSHAKPCGITGSNVGQWVTSAMAMTPSR